MAMTLSLSMLPFIGLPVGCGFVGAASTASAVRSAWYDGLKKPFFQPPSWLFAPVWTSLYCAMGYASWLVWEASGADGGKGGVASLLDPSSPFFRPLALYFGQLAINAAWSPLFFGARNIGGALACILLMDGAVAATISAFFDVGQSTAAYLLFPYMAWISFATLLNGSIFFLNRPGAGDKAHSS